MGSSHIARAAGPRPPQRRTTGEDITELDPSGLVAQLGGEVAAMLSTALERVNGLATTGRIDRGGLRALREEIEQARRIGIMGQQVSRFASGRVRLQKERLDLCAMLREALLQRGRELEARGIEVRQVLQPAQVVGDAALSFSLLQAVLDWSFEHSRGRIELALDVKTWPQHARLVCHFSHCPPDEVTSAPVPLEQSPTLDTVSWRLVQQTAVTLGLLITRDEDAGRTRLVIEFPQTINEPIEGIGTVALADPAEPSTNSQPLAGSHVLVVSASREVRNRVREAVLPMGLMIDYTTSVAEAREFCRGGLPHALVHDDALAGPAFDALRHELLAEVPALAFIEISAHGRGFEVRQVGQRQHASVGRAAIVESLPSALHFELSRSGL